MFIRKVEVKGFRIFKEYHCFHFDKSNLIVGRNRLGKSSVGEAIAFCVAGTDRFGKERAADRLMNNESNEFSIIVHFDTKAGSFVIERRVVKLKGKTENTLFINGAASPQDMIDTIIGNRAHFLASFLPHYLLRMTDKELEQEIVPLIPTPKQESVLEVLAEEDPLAAELLEGKSLIDPNYYMTTQRQHLKEQKEELLLISGRLEEVQAALDADIPESIEVDTSEIDLLKSSITAIESAKPKLQETSELEQLVRKLENDNRLLNEKISFDANTLDCPNCGHEIDLAPDVHAKNEAISKQMAANNTEIMEAKEHIEDFKKANEAAEAAFTATNAETLFALRSDLSSLEEKLAITNKHNMRVQVMKEAKDSAKNRKKELLAEKTQAMKVIENTEKLIAAVKLFNIKRCEMQLESVSAHLNRASIRLFEIVKSTGEMKPAFKATFDDKEVRLLSTSEEILCFLEFSNLVRKLTNSEYPVFVDYGESIEPYEKPDVQHFEARFVDGKPLTVNGEAPTHE